LTVDKLRRFLLGAILAFAIAPAVAAADEKVDPPPLSPDDIAILTRAEDYLNKLDSLQARFVQVSSNGAYAEGEVFVDRPGHLRFDYDPPSTVLLVSNGLTLLYYDRELKQASYIPLWETPLWFLVREEVDLSSDDLLVTDIEEGLGTLSVTLKDRDTPDSGQVTLIFSDDPITLRKWEVVDGQGILTQVSLVNPVFGEEIDPELFEYSQFELNKGQRRTD
jgi:outer membrane lipoprotein-sorting protein